MLAVSVSAAPTEPALEGAVAIRLTALRLQAVRVFARNALEVLLLAGTGGLAIGGACTIGVRSCHAAIRAGMIGALAVLLAIRLKLALGLLDR